MNILLNGIGRIGKAIFKIISATDNLKIVVINEINSNLENIVYSINYDSTYGRLEDKFFIDGNSIRNLSSFVKITNHNKLEDIDFKSLNIDIIVDSSGSEASITKLKRLPVKAIFLTHPKKDADINVVLGVNDKDLDPKIHKVVSTSSCNATAILPLIKLIDDNFDIQYGDITTVHPLLNHQKVLDSACVGSYDRNIKCNFEFGRSSVQNIIPSKTTTIEACSYLIPKINSSIISSSSLRVPTDIVGAINIIFFVKKECNKEQVIELCKRYANNQVNNIMLNNIEPLVSSDFQKQDYTTIVDHRFLDVKKGKMIKLVIWYDNEWGYASKVVDILKLYGKILT